MANVIRIVFLGMFFSLTSLATLPKIASEIIVYGGVTVFVELSVLAGVFSYKAREVISEKDLYNEDLELIKNLLMSSTVSYTTLAGLLVMSAVANFLKDSGVKMAQVLSWLAVSVGLLGGVFNTAVYAKEDVHEYAFSANQTDIRKGSSEINLQEALGVGLTTTLLGPLFSLIGYRILKNISEQKPACESFC